jgi:hypothetical protein
MGVQVIKLENGKKTVVNSWDDIPINVAVTFLEQCARHEKEDLAATDVLNTNEKQDDGTVLIRRTIKSRRPDRTVCELYLNFVYEDEDDECEHNGAILSDDTEQPETWYCPYCGETFIYCEDE